MRLRIREAIEDYERRTESRLLQAEIARQVGVSAVTVSHWVNGKVKPEYRNIEALAALLGIHPTDLYDFKEGVPRTPPQGASLDVYWCPVVGEIAAGGPTDMHQERQQTFLPVPKAWGAHVGCKWIVARGDSMIDSGIQDGTYVLLDPDRKPAAGKIVAIDINGEQTLKRITYDEEDRPMLLSDNRSRGNDYRAKRLRKTDVNRIIGVSLGWFHVDP